MLLNNISASFFHIEGKLSESEYFNDMALMEDPDYAKAMLRKVLILQKKGYYKEAHSIAGFAIMRFDDEYEDERNRKIVPELKAVRDQLEGKASIQKKKNDHRLQEEAEREMGFGKEDDQPGFFDLIDEFTNKVEIVKAKKKKELGSAYADSSDEEDK